LADYSPPENLVATVSGNDVSLQWDVPEYQPQALSAYNVYRNGVLLETITETNYDDLDLIGESYEYYITAVYTYGNSAASNLVEIAELDAEDLLAQSAELSNYPNPFNPQTTIFFTLNQEMPASLTIFNLKGQVVRKYQLNEANLGKNEIVWDGTDAEQNPVASGLYLYRLEAGEQIISKRMMLLK